MNFDYQHKETTLFYHGEPKYRSEDMNIYLETVHTVRNLRTVDLSALAIIDIVYLYVTVLTEWLTKVYALRFGACGNLGCSHVMFTWFLSFMNHMPRPGWLLC